MTDEMAQQHSAIMAEYLSCLGVPMFLKQVLAVSVLSMCAPVVCAAQDIFPTTVWVEHLPGPSKARTESTGKLVASIGKELLEWGTVRQVRKATEAILGVHIVEQSTQERVTVVFTLNPGTERKLLTALSVTILNFSPETIDFSMQAVGNTLVGLAAEVRNASAKGQDVVSAITAMLQNRR